MAGNQWFFLPDKPKWRAKSKPSYKPTAQPKPQTGGEPQSGGGWESFYPPSWTPWADPTSTTQNVEVPRPYTPLFESAWSALRPIFERYISGTGGAWGSLPRAAATMENYSVLSGLLSMLTGGYMDEDVASITNLLYGEEEEKPKASSSGGSGGGGGGGYSGIDLQWWEQFKKEHGGKDPVQYYGGDPNIPAQFPGSVEWALAQADYDRAWGEQFYRTYGRPPSEYDWKASYYDRMRGFYDAAKHYFNV